MVLSAVALVVWVVVAVVWQRRGGAPARPLAQSHRARDGSRGPPLARLSVPPWLTGGLTLPPHRQGRRVLATITMTFWREGSTEVSKGSEEVVRAVPDQRMCKLTTKNMIC